MSLDLAMLAHPAGVLGDVALAAAALVAGNEFCVAAFVHPVISRLDDPAHAAAAAPVARVLGRWMPPAYATVLLLLLIAASVWPAGPVGGLAWWLVVAAAAAWAIVIVVTIARLVPTNNRVARLDPARPYDGWQVDRRAWDRLHRGRVAFLLLCVALLLAAQIVR